MEVGDDSLFLVMEASLQSQTNGNEKGDDSANGRMRVWPQPRCGAP